MAVRSCKVTIKDMEGVDHTVDVTASTLYEAVALGIAAIRSDDWVTEIAQGLNSVKVRVTNVAVEHEVRLKDFTSWLEESTDLYHASHLHDRRFPLALCEYSSNQQFVPGHGPR